MDFFVVSVRVPLLLWTLLIASTSSDKIMEKSTDTSVITNFLRHIVIPYLETNQHINGKRKEDPADDNMLMTQVENAIIQKVKKLKPMLQNSEHIKIKPNSDVKLDEENKATTLEFMSENKRKGNFKIWLKDTQRETDTSYSKIEKYKQRRRHITVLLNKEKTSSSTSKLITKTLDDMLDLLTERKCQWKNLNKAVVVNYLLKNLSHSEGQQNLMCYLRPGKPDIYIVSDQGHPEEHTYMKSSNKTIIQENEVKDKDQCDSFTVCTEVLTDFLKLTYHLLNDTAVSTFTNYVAMYIRDAKEDTFARKEDVSIELEYLSDLAKKKVYQIFLQELEHFTLDENEHKTQNIAYLKNFIKETTAHINSRIHSIVVSELIAMNSELFLTIKDDLSVNLKMDLDNLSQRLETKICRFFVLCNSIERRSKISNKFPTVNNENIYVRLRHRFDEDLQKPLDQYLNSPQEQTIRSHAIKPKKHSHVTRNTVRSMPALEGTFSSENGTPDKFFK